MEGATVAGRSPGGPTSAIFVNCVCIAPVAPLVHHGDMDSGALLLGLLCFFSGALVAWLVAHSRVSRRLNDLSALSERAGAECEAARREATRAGGEVSLLRSRLEEESRARAIAETELRTSRAAMEQQTQFIGQAREQLEGTYARLSQTALRAAIEQLSAQMRPQLEGTRGEISTTLEAKKTEIEGLIRPLREMLEKYQSELGRSERERIDAYGQLSKHIETLFAAQGQARDAAHKLEHALRNPGVRGAWGETSLRNCIELAGMASYCDFVEQASFDSDEGRKLRPDVVIRLPHERFIPIDSKAPIDAWLEAANESDEQRRRDLLDQHAKNLRRHIDALSKRRYEENVGDALDFTVMFIGGEQFLSAALMTDPSLFEYAAEKKIVLATPTVLLPLLRAVATGWKAERTEESARRALELGRDLVDRFSVLFTHLSEVGASLGKAVDSYNRTIRSAESRLLPKARELAEATDARKEIPPPEQVALHPVDVPRLRLLEEDDTDEPVS